MTKSQIKESIESIFEKDDKKIQIKQMELIHLLEKLGFGICRDNKSGYNNQLIRRTNNIIEIYNKDDLGNMLVELMKEHNLTAELIEKFVRGISSYLSPAKLNILSTIKLNLLQSTRDITYFNFLNVIVKVSKDGYEVLNYNEIENSVLSEQRIDKTFNLEKSSDGCNFKEFCEIITGGNKDRFNSLKSILGYLLHPNKEAREDKAVILYDAHMGTKKFANGGTGKTLLINGAINQMRNVVVIDGKRYDNRNSRFLYQNLTPASNIVFFDDVNGNFNFEDVFSVITGDFEIEKKNKQSIVLEYKYAPKLVISSNSEVKMLKGSSSERRNIELVLDNAFSSTLSPKDIFGEIFFSTDWNEEQFNRFFLFMIECNLFYHQNGLIEYTDEDLEIRRLKGVLGKELYHFFSDIISNYDNEWLAKKEIVEYFKSEYNLEISSHMFTKAINKYCIYKGFFYNEKNSGSVVKFIISSDKKGGGE